MRTFLTTLLIATAGMSVAADDTTATDTVFITEPVAIDSFQWTHRPVLVFADSPNDPRFIEQLENLQARAEALADRDVVVLTDTDPDARSDLRRQFRPRGFMLVLIGKDGEVKLRKPSPWDVREITRSIDKMPMRQQEIRERRAAEVAEG